jgi:hypothetical protein
MKLLARFLRDEDFDHAVYESCLGISRSKSASHDISQIAKP